jgi:hypothetical protein
MSYLGGLALLFIVVVGGIFGLVMIINHAPLTAPIDSAGTTVSPAENATRQAAEDSAPSLMYMAGAIGLIVGFMLLIAAGLYLAAAGKSNFRSKY